MNSQLLDTELEFAVKRNNNNNGKYMDLTNEFLRDLIQDNKFEDIRRLLNKNKTLVNSPILVNEFTALHLASLMGQWRIVDLLVKDYHADVNVSAKDGTQPIHLSSFSAISCITDDLLGAGANPEAEITKEMYLKYKKMSEFLKDTEWCSDFGDTMTLVTFNTVVIHSEPALADFVIKFKANLNITSHTNQTLLMHLCGKGIHLGRITSANNLEDKEVINARDNDGFTAVHYLLRSDGFAICPSLREFRRVQNLLTLVRMGVDIDATVNGDPDTLLLNIAASRGLSAVLDFLLPYCTYKTKSKALRNIILYSDFSDSYFDRLTEFHNPYEVFSPELKILSAASILKGLVNKLAFDLYVPEEEKKLMDQLIAKHSKVQELVHTHQETIINGVLKNEVIQYGEKSITFYDFVSLSVNNRKLRSLIKNQTFMDAYRESNINFGKRSFLQDVLKNNRKELDISYFRLMIKVRVGEALKKIELLEQLKKIEQLRKAVPLPFEIILEIFDYLDSTDFEKFIDSFISN